MLRANDVQRHILNIDSRFRQSGGASSDFYFQVSPPIKNVLRIRVTSIEFPNNYHFFTEKRRNVSFRVLYKIGGTGMASTITVPDGNYTAGEMEDAIKTILADPANGLTWLSVAFDGVTGAFTFTGTQYFGIDTVTDSYVRPFDYGLGYYLGFSRRLHTGVKVGNTWTATSDQCAHFAGDSYVFLQVNDFACVRHNTDTTELQALAKVVLREPKNYMSFDDYASQHVKEVVFPAPQNIARLRIRVVDAYGEVVDLCSTNFSFSLEVLEIRNSSLYNAVRDSLGVVYS